MILNFYHRNGKKERRPLGYGGGLCHEATKPYERREIPGQMRNTPTPEAYQEPADTTGESVVERQQLRG